MYLLYIDESGDLGSMPNPIPSNGNHQPVLVVGGLLIPAKNLDTLTLDFVHLKDRFYPNLMSPAKNYLDKILIEIKGSDIRRNALRGNRSNRRHAIGFLDKLLETLKSNQVELIARVWVKPIGQPFNGKAVYTSAIQSMYQSFEMFLTKVNGFGVSIADSRDFSKNVNVAHSIFTKKFSSAAPAFGRILELPVFGHSNNHAALQICDIVCSALIYPISTYAYCNGHVSNVHVQPSSAHLRTLFGAALKSMQFRYQDQFDRWRGGITTSDPIAHQNATAIFATR